MPTSAPPDARSTSSRTSTSSRWAAPSPASTRRRPPSASARAPYLVALDSNWTARDENRDQVAWVRQGLDAIATFGTGGTYLNFSGRVDERIDAGVGDALGRNLRRLAAVKAAYDPDNLFHRNNNIVPAS